MAWQFEVTQTGDRDLQVADDFRAAVARASTSNRMTYVTIGGHRTAAIVPVDFAVALDPVNGNGQHAS